MVTTAPCSRYYHYSPHSVADSMEDVTLLAKERGWGLQEQEQVKEDVDNEELKEQEEQEEPIAKDEL